MGVLWDSGKPMSSMEIIEAAPAGTWGEKSEKNVHRIIRRLLKKEMIEVCGQVRSGTQYARLFQPTITREEYEPGELTGFESNSLIKIALGLTKVVEKNEDNQNEKNEEAIEGLEKMIEEFRGSTKEDNESGKDNA